MGSDQGGTPDAPRGCPVAAMPVRQAHPSHWSGPRAACCRWNQPASGSARWIASCPLLGTAARFAVPTPSAAFPIGMANGDRPAPSAPSSVPPLGAVISTSGGSAARDPHPPDGRDRDEDRDGPSGFGSMATLRRFVRDGDLTAEHHGCRGRGRPRFALTATPGSPACRAIAPGTALARSALPGTPPSGKAPRRGPRGSRRFVSAAEETPGRRGFASAMAELDSGGRSGTGEPRIRDTIRQNTQ